MDGRAFSFALGTARALAGVGILVAASSAPAAVLPAHRPIRVLVVSDEVNPNGLTPAQLTQPGDLSAAFLDAGSGLNLSPLPESVFEVPTDQIENATTRLLRARTDPTAYDVLVYFAHRIPAAGGNEAARQQAFVDAVEGFLEDGGGVVSFHHGSYVTAGKEAILDLIGVQASSIAWNTMSGQNVIATAPRHFVDAWNVTYSGNVAYADPARGVAAGTYPFLNNTPDERYPAFEKNLSAGAFRVLFGSDYVQNGSTHLLGFTHRRPAWKGRVVGYQPGEYQPNALNVAGPNFQILANAMIWAADAFVRGFFPVAPCRVLDTRNGPATPLAAGATLVVGLTGACGVPTTAKAAAVNLTVTQPTEGGEFALYPAETTPPPPTSSLSYGAGRTRANNAVIGLSELGEVAILSRQAAGSAHVILDVCGYFQ